MATVKKGTLTRAGEWWVHLRPYGKREFWKGERKAWRKEMANQIMIDDGDNGENCEAVVCIGVTNPLKYPDNLVGECTQCGFKIQYRPHAPKNPPKICVRCAMPEIMKAVEENNFGMVITEKTKQDVIEYLKKKSH